MNNTFNKGDIKQHFYRVCAEDIAKFESGTVHNVLSTFALGREVEWCCRLFVLDMKESTEEGIGTFLSIEHKSPAMLQSEICVEATFESLDRNELICSYVVRVDDRVIAKGKQGQKIVAKTKLKAHFDQFKK